MNWESVAAHGEDQPFEPARYSTRVGYVTGLIAYILTQIMLAPFTAAMNWLAGADRPLIDSPLGMAFFLAISFPFVARGGHNFLSQRGETRTLAYALAGATAYFLAGILTGAFQSLAWIASAAGGAAAMAAYRAYNIPRAG